MTAWADYAAPAFALVSPPSVADVRAFSGEAAPLLDSSEHSWMRPVDWTPNGLPADGDFERLPWDSATWATDEQAWLKRCRGWVTVQDKLADACDRLLAAGADVAGRFAGPDPIEPILGQNGTSIPGRPSELGFRTVDEHGVVPPDSDAGILWNWSKRLRECSTALALVKDGETGRLGVMGDCCRCPACPRQQRRRAAEQRAAMEWMLDHGFHAQGGKHPTHCRKRLSLHEGELAKEGVLTPEDVRRILFAKDGTRARDARSYGWKMLTLTFRNVGILEQDVRTALRLRGLAIKRLREYLDAPVDGWGAVEVSPKGFVHLHCLLYIPIVHAVERAAFRRWERGATCDVPGCAHPEGDYTTCGGSDVHDVRATYDKTRKGEKRSRRKLTGAEHRQNWRNAALEAVKYATAPMTQKEGKLSALTSEDAERNVRCLLVLWKKHRVESYGMARRKSEVVTPDDGDSLEDLKMRRPVILAYLTRQGPYLMVVQPPAHRVRQSVNPQNTSGSGVPPPN